MNKDSGFLLVDKPVGISSFDVIRSLRRITGIRSIGHTGTLDPLASGLLVCCLGSCTKLARFVESEAKTYEAVCSFGYETDTGDQEGQVIRTASLPKKMPEPVELSEQIMMLRTLPIPIYSAKKIMGKKAYQYAREGIMLEMPDKETTIHSFDIISLNNESIAYRCRVSKGTFVRSLSQYIANLCGTVGTTTALKRLSIGTLLLSESVSLSELDSQNWQSYLKQPKDILGSYPSLCLAEPEIKDLLNGRLVPHQGRDTEHIMVYDSEDRLVSVSCLTNNLLKPQQNFPNG